jgi:hypothetical protein
MLEHVAVRARVLIALVGLVLGGCAGARGTVKAVTPADVPALSGVWQGTMTGVSGVSFPATLTVNADGTYFIRGGALSAQGKAQADEGHLDFVSTATSGVGAIGDRIGTAVLMDRGDSWSVVGWARAPAGPYNFDFGKVK